MPARNEQEAPSIFGLTERQLLAVALAVAAMRASGHVPTADTSLEVALTAAPASGLAGQGLSDPG